MLLSFQLPLASPIDYFEELPLVLAFASPVFPPLKLAEDKDLKRFIEQAYDVIQTGTDLLELTNNEIKEWAKTQSSPILFSALSDTEAQAKARQDPQKNKPLSSRTPTHQPQQKDKTYDWCVEQVLRTNGRTLFKHYKVTQNPFDVSKKLINGLRKNKGLMKLVTRLVHYQEHQVSTSCQIKPYVGSTHPLSLESVKIPPSTSHTPMAILPPNMDNLWAELPFYLEEGPIYDQEYEDSLTQSLDNAQNNTIIDYKGKMLLHDIICLLDYYFDGVEDEDGDLSSYYHVPEVMPKLLPSLGGDTTASLPLKPITEEEEDKEGTTQWTVKGPMSLASSSPVRRKSGCTKSNSYKKNGNRYVIPSQRNSKRTHKQSVTV